MDETNADAIERLANTVGEAGLPNVAHELAMVAYLVRQELAEAEAVLEKLQDPSAVHLNMLRGGIAKLTPSMLRHLYASDFEAEKARGINEGLEEAAQVLDAYGEYDAQVCCNGQGCGCQGSTVHEMIQHFIRALITKPTESEE